MASFMLVLFSLGHGFCCARSFVVINFILLIHPLSVLMVYFSSFHVLIRRLNSKNH